MKDRLKISPPRKRSEGRRGNFVPGLSHFHCLQYQTIKACERLGTRLEGYVLDERQTSKVRGWERG